MELSKITHEQAFMMLHNGDMNIDVYAQLYATPEEHQYIYELQKIKARQWALSQQQKKTQEKQREKEIQQQLETAVGDAASKIFSDLVKNLKQ